MNHVKTAFHSLVVIALMLGLGIGVNAAIDAATKCEVNKVKTAGKYEDCRLKATAKAVKTGEPADYTKCIEKFGLKWIKAESKADGACPTNGDQATIAAKIVVDADSIADGLAGTPEMAACEAIKLKGAGKCAKCRLNAESKAIKKVLPPDFTKCHDKFDTGWSKAETKFGTACPALGQAAVVEAEIIASTDSIAFLLSGATTTTTSTSTTTTTSSTTTSTTPPAVARCGDLILDPGEECETDGDCAAGQACSVCCTCVDATCPDVMEWTMHAGTGAASTSTELDLGWSGITHDVDLADSTLLDLKLCAHAGSGPAACGEASVGGIDPSPGNCRCVNDNRAVCDQPFEADADDCGGAQCICYLAPPEPFSGYRETACSLRRLAGDITGTWNVDVGAGALTVPLRNQIFLGITVVKGCPTCDGDVTPNDGIRDGTCNGGEDDGQTCDANSSDATFPAPGGGYYSYDCFPTFGKNITGIGLVGDHVLTTGSESLGAAVPCGVVGFPGYEWTCPCATCAGDRYLPCSSNSDCGTLGPCNQAGLNEIYPNQCSDQICNAVGGNEGECNTGPDDSFCDGIVHADGTGILHCDPTPRCEDDYSPCTTNGDCNTTFNCVTDLDCRPASIGVTAGDCTLTERRRCFLDPIAATGSASTTDPVAVTTYCTPGTGNPQANDIIGLPGPVRAAIQATSTFRCAGDPGSTYPSCP